jgi:multidrug transporter EmrE-like cation transporter
MNGIFLMLALFLDLAAAISLKRSQGFSKRLPALAMVVFSIQKEGKDHAKGSKDLYTRV